MYNIAAFCRFLGNPLDNTCTSNVMYFDAGKCRSVRIQHTDDVQRAEQFVSNNDGRHQMYINVNPALPGTPGKPKDVDILAVMNLYLDIDAKKAAGTRINPATEGELEATPINAIMNAVCRKYPVNRVDFTGNGWRVLIPMQCAVADDQLEFVTYMYGRFPDHIDRSVIDPSRVTGVPGTTNVKTPTKDRPNRVRDSFVGSGYRITSLPAEYTTDELPPIRTPIQPSVRNHAVIDVAPVVPEHDTQQLLNAYILMLSRQAPHILEILSSSPDASDGFAYDSFFACEVLTKIGNAPRVFATICKAHWGSDYSAVVTEGIWDRTVSEGVGVWSNATMRRYFGGIK